MRKAQSNSTILASWFKNDEIDEAVIVTIDDYLNFLKDSDKNKISEFIYQRFYTRYIKPFEYSTDDYNKNYKNGFSIMANCCLLIEALESFKNGWKTTDSISKEAFVSFFSSEGEFIGLKPKALSFYKNIRCGILHQGETTAGWKITRSGTTYYDESSKTIDAVLFMARLKISLKNYCDKLTTSDWDSEVWDNLRQKMSKIISNCA